MIRKIKNKIYDIESKVSGNFIPPIEVSAPNETLGIPTVLRHSTLLQANTSAPLVDINTEMQSLELCYADLLRLSAVFYNGREYQLKNLKQRYDLLKLRRQGLTSLGLGVKTGTIQLNDKKLLVPANTYDFVDSGITSKPTTVSVATPKAFSISTDSNIIIGNLQNKLLNSVADSIFSTNQNDLFSVHRRDRTDLSLIMSFTFNKNKEIINEIQLKLVEKPGQTINIAIYNMDNEELIYSGVYSSEPIAFSKPVKTTSLEMVITSSGIPENQLDIIEIVFYRKMFRTPLGNNLYGLKATTINIPSFSGKYLTLEDVTLQYPEHSSLLNFEVRANNEKLHALKDEEQLSGPYIDPNFELICSLKDSNTLLEYLGDLEYEKCTADKINDTYKVFASIMTEDPYEVTQNIPSAEENVVLFPLTLKGFENFFNVRVNGERYSQIKESDTLEGKTYKIVFTGDGYILKFKSLPQYSKILASLTGCPSYLEHADGGYQIVFPWLGLGTTLAFEYPTKQMRESRIIDNRSSVVDLNRKHIVKFSFVSSVFQEKALGAVLGANDYSVDYLNGFLYRGASVMGEASFTSTDSKMHSTKLLHDTYAIKIPNSNRVNKDSGSSIFINTVNVKKDDLATVSFSSYHKDNGLDVDVNNTSNYIQLPSCLSLLRESVALLDEGGGISKKEVPFFNGKDELNNENKVFLYYDYIRTIGNLHEYRIRHRAAVPGNLFYSKIEVQDINFNSRKTFDFEITADGDYYFDSSMGPALMGRSLWIMSGQRPPVSVPVTVTTTEMDNTFSVDYLQNRIYTNSLSDYDGKVKFSYTTLLLKDFEIAIEVNKKDVWGPNEYAVIASNGKDLSELLPYFSPVIKSISIGIIG
jgi:hypothetical protein